MTGSDTGIIGGVDTHQDLHTAAIVTLEGAVLGTESFSTTRAGYRAMLAWFRSHGELLRVGVESTGSYGAGIARHLALSGVPVLEVTGPDRAARRARGKDDALDAVAAAEAARTGCRVQVAKDRGGAVEALRVLRTTRKTAVKCRRAALQQLHNTIVAAPDEVRDQVRDLTRMRRLRICAAWRPDAAGYRDPTVATKLSLKSLARRILDLDGEIAELDRFIAPLVEELAPDLLKLESVGTASAGELLVTAGENPERLRSEASFAMLCGACPLPASSGKTQRHRLNRGGNRQANSALHMIVLCRMRADPRTRTYVERRTGEGLSKRVRPVEPVQGWLAEYQPGLRHKALDLRALAHQPLPRSNVVSWIASMELDSSAETSRAWSQGPRGIPRSPPGCWRKPPIWSELGGPAVASSSTRRARNCWHALAKLDWPVVAL